MPRPRSTTRRERNAWRVMIRRCTELTHKDWPRYGGAGIRVCPEWMSFDQFLKDMRPATTQQHWLGRLKVLGNYEPGNCVWTTQPPQERRRTFCRMVNVSGQTVTAAEAARALGTKRDTLLRRLANGLPPAMPGKLYKRSMLLTLDDETLPLPHWARKLGLPSSVIWSRIKRGWPVEEALMPHRIRNPKPRAMPLLKPTT